MKYLVFLIMVIFFSITRQCGHRQRQPQADSRFNMVTHCQIPNRQVQIPTKETHALLAQG